MSDNAEQIEAKLAAYIDGELSAAERAEIEAHLEANPSHKALVGELMMCRELVKQLPRETAPAGLLDDLQNPLERQALLADDAEERRRSVIFRIFRAPQGLSMAAIVTLAVGLGALVYFVLPPKHPRVALAPAPEERAAMEAVAEGETKSIDSLDKVLLDNAVATAFPANTEAYGIAPSRALSDTGAGAAPAAEADAFGLAAGESGATMVLTVTADDLDRARSDVLAYLADNRIAWSAADGTPTLDAARKTVAIGGAVGGASGAGVGAFGERFDNGAETARGFGGGGGASANDPASAVPADAMALSRSPARFARPTDGDRADAAKTMEPAAKSDVKDAQAAVESLQKKNEEMARVPEDRFASAKQQQGAADESAQAQKLKEVEKPATPEPLAAGGAGQAGQSASAGAQGPAMPAAASSAAAPSASVPAGVQAGAPANLPQPTAMPAPQQALAAGSSVEGNAPAESMTRSRRGGESQGVTETQAETLADRAAGRAAMVQEEARLNVARDLGAVAVASRPESARNLILVRNVNPRQVREMATTLNRPEHRQVALVQPVAAYAQRRQLARPGAMEAEVVPLGQIVQNAPTTMPSLSGALRGVSDARAEFKDASNGVRLELGTLTRESEKHQAQSFYATTQPVIPTVAVGGVLSVREAGPLTISVPSTQPLSFRFLDQEGASAFTCVIVLRANLPDAPPLPTTVPAR